MAKTRARAEPITSVTITYDLFDLPTAQHKAGLAGLVLQIRSMEERAKQGGPPALDAMPTLDAVITTSATVTFTEKTVQGLFDDVYDAHVVEVAVKSKWQGQAPKREEEVEEKDAEGKTKKTKRFIYDVTQARGHFLRQHLPDGEGVWLKLWRDMLWSIPRGNPNTRIPFEERAEKKHCKEGKVAWDDLVKAERARKKNGFYTSEVAGALWLGAQATNAESIPFEGRAEQNLLLHFWPLTTQIFVPQQIDYDGAGDFVGYVLAIPEVNDLKNFVVDYPLMLSQLGKDVRGFRPADAVIDLPAQGALAFLEHLARLASQKAEGATKFSVGSVEFLHLAKFGNNIKSMAAGRIEPRANLLEQYTAIVGGPGRPPRYRNPLFRRGLMMALLDDREWYEPMASILADWPAPFFVVGERTPRSLPGFYLDARQKFHDEAEDYQHNLEVYRTMSAADSTVPRRASETPPSLLIHRLVRRYLNEKTKEKSDIDLEKFKEGGKINWKKVPPEFSKAKRKLAEGVFLEFRSRRDQAFVDHFVATFCSTKQYLSERDYCAVADQLMNQTEHAKTLTLLALSANS